MKQAFLVGEKVRITLVGEVKEAYSSFNFENKSDCVRYKIESPDGTVIAAKEDVITKAEAR